MGVLRSEEHMICCTLDTGLHTGRLSMGKLVGSYENSSWKKRKSEATGQRGDNGALRKIRMQRKKMKTKKNQNISSVASKMAQLEKALATKSANLEFNP